MLSQAQGLTSGYPRSPSLLSAQTRSQSNPPRLARCLVVQAEGGSEVKLLEKPHLKRPEPPKPPTPPSEQKAPGTGGTKQLAQTSASGVSPLSGQNGRRDIYRSSKDRITMDRQSTQQREKSSGQQSNGARPAPARQVQQISQPQGDVQKQMDEASGARSDMRRGNASTATAAPLSQPAATSAGELQTPQASKPLLRPNVQSPAKATAEAAAPSQLSRSDDDSVTTAAPTQQPTSESAATKPVGRSADPAVETEACETAVNESQLQPEGVQRPQQVEAAPVVPLQKPLRPEAAQRPQPQTAASSTALPASRRQRPSRPYRELTQQKPSPSKVAAEVSSSAASSNQHAREPSAGGEAKESEEAAANVKTEEPVAPEQPELVMPLAALRPQPPKAASTSLATAPPPQQPVKPAAKQTPPQRLQPSTAAPSTTFPAALQEQQAAEPPVVDGTEQPEPSRAAADLEMVPATLPQSRSVTPLAAQRPQPSKAVSTSAAVASSPRRPVKPASEEMPPQRRQPSTGDPSALAGLQEEQAAEIPDAPVEEQPESSSAAADLETSSAIQPQSQLAMPEVVQRPQPPKAAGISTAAAAPSPSRPAEPATQAALQQKTQPQRAAAEASVLAAPKKQRAVESEAQPPKAEESLPSIQGPPTRKPQTQARPVIDFRRNLGRKNVPQMEGRTAERSAIRRPQLAQASRIQPQFETFQRPQTARTRETEYNEAPAPPTGDVSDNEGLTTDTEDSLDVPSLSAKPARRPAASKARVQNPNLINDVRAFRRMPSEMRQHQFERPASAEGVKFVPGWRQKPQNGATGTSSIPDSEKKAAAGQPRDSRTKKKGREKQDIEKTRASRYERRQQRLEQQKATAREQEEIFEVGSEGMPVGELAEKLAVNSGDVLKALFLRGIMAQVNQVLDKDMVKIVAEEYGVEVLDLEEAGLDTMARKTADYVDEDDIDFLVPRPPVVTVMGHVDHGKTSLLDYIRKTKVAAGEAGGITQAIGAYTCEVDTADEERKKITFLDTPGHEAFSAMRARGTKVTDIAIIVVACDDGVRPQTQEAISHAKAAKVPIVVALNKIDKEGANVEKAKQEMSEAGLLPEEWGGDTPMVQISAKKGTGIDDLLETILLVAELEQLAANPHRMARGTVVEAHLDRRMGPAATLLVATGTLRVGDVLHAGASYGKVRGLTNSTGQPVEEAGPSIAVQLVGLNSVPVAGDEFAVLESEQEARKVATAIEDSQRLSRLAEQAGGSMVTSMTFATMDDDGEGLQYLNLVLKADASGAVEAVKGALQALPQDRVTLRFLMAAAGEITASDVQLAYASEGHIIGFNLEPSETVMAQAKQLGVVIQPYKVIYELIDDIRDLMEGKLGSVEERLPLGEAEVRAVFGSGSKKVAGCMVTEGLLKKSCLVVVTRGKRQVYEGTLVSLRRGKENVNEVSNGNECGLGVDIFNEWREGDKIEAFEVKSKRQTLEEASEREVVNSLSASLDEDDFPEA